ncbi:ATP-binding protein [Sulfurospirillum sp. SCADC]|nr:ATP-binding protein [Sulfurospirillum sp. SCADC]
MSVKASFFSLTMLVLLGMIAFEFYNWKEDREEVEALSQHYAQEMSENFKQLMLDKAEPYRKQTLDISAAKQVIVAVKNRDQTWFEDNFGGSLKQLNVDLFFLLDQNKIPFFNETSQPFLSDLSSLFAVDQLSLNDASLKHFFVKRDEGLVEFFIAPIHDLGTSIDATHPAEGFLVIGKLWDMAWMQKLNSYGIAEINFGKKIAEPYTIIHDLPLLGFDGKTAVTLYLSSKNQMGKYLDEYAIQDLKLSFVITALMMVVFIVLIMKFISLPLRDIMLALEHKDKTILRKYLLKENEYGAIATELCESFDAKHKLEELNAHLEQKVEQEVEKSRLKDRVLFQQAKFAALGEMLSSIAHQWRQPLNTISVVVSKIYLESKMEKLTKEGLEEEIIKLREHIALMSSLIEEFKDFFSQEGSKVDFMLRRSIEESIKITDGGLANKDMTFEVECPEDIVIHNFKKELSHVLLVLINNAKDAILRREIAHGTIRIKGFLQEQSIVIEVLDNAGGVEEAQLPYLFDPFFTTKDPTSGSGTGLYIAKQIIEQNMQGSISARNEQSGLCMHIVLPQS